MFKVFHLTSDREKSKTYIQFLIYRVGMNRISGPGRNLISEIMLNKQDNLLYNILRSKNIHHFNQILKNPMYMGAVYKQVETTNVSQACRNFMQFLILSKSYDNQVYIQQPQLLEQELNDKKPQNKQYIETKVNTKQQGGIQYITVYKIRQQYNIFNHLTQKSLRQIAVVMLYKTYVLFSNRSYNQYHNLQQDAMNLIEYILAIEDQQFQDEFRIASKKDVQLLVQMVYETKIESLTQFVMKTKIARHMQYSTFRLELQEDIFKKISKDTFKELFDNIENRILNVYSDSNGYLIAHRLQDNEIFVFYAKSNINKDQFNHLLQKFEDDQIYDIIITGCPYAPIEKIKMRYLCVTGDIEFQLRLDHSQSLISFSLGNTYLPLQCTYENVRNFYAFNLKLTIDQISSFKSLQRLYCIKCYSDCDHNTGIINILTKQNKLQYIACTDGYGMLSSQNNFPMFYMQHLYLKNKYINVNVKCDINIFFDNQIESLYKTYICLKTKGTKNKMIMDGQPRLNQYRYYFNKTYQKIQLYLVQKLQHVITFMHEYINIWDQKFYFINRALQYYYNILYLSTIKKSYEKRLSKYLYRYLKNFDKFRTYKSRNNLEDINLHKIQTYYELKKQKADNFKDKLFFQIYDDYIIDKKGRYGSDSKYIALLVLKRILNCNQQQLSEVYGDLSYKTTEYISNFIYQYSVDTLSKTYTKLKMGTSLLYSYIQIYFTSNFYQTELNDQTLQLMFKDVDKRLQRVDGNAQMFYIKDINSSKINKLLRFDEFQYIDDFATQFTNNEVLYDAVIVGYKPSCIENIRLRYLNYTTDEERYKKQDPQKLTPSYLYLSYPQDLVSLSVSKIHVKFLDKCVNVEYFDSIQNKYKFGVFSNWTKLKVFSCYKDIQEDDKQKRAIVNDLFTHNNMHYISVSNCIKMFHSDIISTGLSQLQFFYHYNKRIKISVTFNITNCFPQHLRVARIGYKEDNKMIEQNVNIQGLQADVEKLQRQLLRF